MSDQPPDGPPPTNLRKDPWAAPAAPATPDPAAPDQPAGPHYTEPSYAQPNYGQPNYGQPNYGQPPPQPFGQPTGPELDPNDPYRYGRPDAPQAPFGAGAPYGMPPEQASPYGPPPSGGYGAYPAAPAYHQYPQPGSGGNGMAIAALVLGIVSLVLCWIPFFAYVPEVLAIIFGILALTGSRRIRGQAGLAIAGLVCAGLAIIGTTAISIYVVNRVHNCSGYTPDTPDYDNCIRHG